MFERSDEEDVTYPLWLRVLSGLVILATILGVLYV